MKFYVILFLIFLSCKSSQVQQQNVSRETQDVTITKISRSDFVTQDIYATFPDVSFHPVVGTDSFRVVQTVSRETSSSSNQIIINAGKKSDINVQAPEQEAPKKVTGRAILNTGSGTVIKEPDKVKTIERDPSSGFSISAGAIFGILALLIVGFLLYWKFFRK